MRTTLRLAALAAVALLTAAGGRADDEKVPLDKLPKAVAEAVKAMFPKAELKEAEKGTTDGKTKYEIKIQDGTSAIELNVTDAGVITDYEKAITLKDLPKAVADTVAAKHPGKTPKVVEEFYTVKDGKGTLAYYEVLFEIDGKDVELEILPDGKPKPEEKKEEKK